LKYVLLTEKFYRDFEDCPEIEKERGRPYLVVLIEMKGVPFAVPFRSHIHHPHAFLTDEENFCGLDFSKTVVITKDEYVDKERSPRIREHEHKRLIGKEYVVKQRLEKYIKAYKKAKKKPEIPRNQNLLQCSTLQYFESYIGEF